MMWKEADEQDRRRLAHDELERHRVAVEAGYQPAIIAALMLCNEERVPVPPWLTSALAKLTFDTFSDRLPSQRGRSAKPIQRRKQDLIDMLRYEMVSQTKAALKELRQMLKEARQRDTDEARTSVANLESCLARAEQNDDEIYLKVSETLTATLAQGGPPAVKRSFLKVRKALQRNDVRYRPLYHRFDKDLVRALP
jgi:hypothetical protein